MSEKSAEVSFPFTDQPGKMLGKGWAESTVYEHGNDWVVKIGHSKRLNSLKHLRSNKADYEFFKTRLGETVPETQFVRGYDQTGHKTNIIRQRRIHGKPLSKYSDQEIATNHELGKNLAQLFSQLVGIWNTEGRIPDLYGMKSGRLGLFDRWHPEHCPNIMVEEATNKIFLVDTSASVGYFSKQSPFYFRISNEALIQGMRKFIGNNR